MWTDVWLCIPTSCWYNYILFFVYHFLLFQRGLLHYSAATGSWIVISTNFQLIPINNIHVRVSLPVVGHLRDRNQLNDLALWEKTEIGETVVFQFNQKLNSSTKIHYYVQIKIIKNKSPVVKSVMSGSIWPDDPWLGALQHLPLHGLGIPLLGTPAQHSWNPTVIMRNNGNNLYKQYVRASDPDTMAYGVQDKVKILHWFSVRGNLQTYIYSCSISSRYSTHCSYHILSVPE